MIGDSPRRERVVLECRSVEARHDLDEIASPMVVWHMDVGNVLRNGWPQHWIETLGAQYVFKLDVKISDGDAGWERVVASLDAIGYDGWAAAEVSGGDAERLADIAARMNRVLGMA